ncbi:hypothetical protein AWENTII_007226 [Aspergillus wentii]
MANLFQSLLFDDGIPGSLNAQPSQSPEQEGDGKKDTRKRAKYIGRACQDCQRRKVKCSGDDVCLHCRVRGIPCIYMPKNRRGRQKGAIQHKKKSPVKPTTPTEWSAPSSMADIVDTTRGLDEDTDAYDVVERRSRGISLASQLQSLRELVCSSKPLSGTSERQSLLNRVFAVELPRPGRMKSLLDVYFRDLDSFFPFLDREETEGRVLGVLEKLGYDEHHHIIDVDFRHHSTVALLCNMIAVAECFSPYENTEDVRPGWSIFVRGRKLIQYCSSPKYVDIDLVRYHALSAEYLMQSELLQAASQAISTASQLAMLDRLNDQRSWENLTPLEIDHRKMLWWILYFLDRKIAQRLGSPYIIRDSEVAVSEFHQITNGPTVQPTYEYMQALINLARLWSQIWDTFFAAAAARPSDWKEIEIMDTRILNSQRELPMSLTWETGMLHVYMPETEPQIRRRLAIYIRTNLLRLTIRHNPLQNDRHNPSAQLCARLASQTVEAIAAFTNSCPSIKPCGFFFSTALIECIYHLMSVVQDPSLQDEKSSMIKSFRLSYRLLVQFSQTLDTAKRAICALHSAVFPDEQDTTHTNNNNNSQNTEIPTPFPDYDPFTFMVSPGFEGSALMSQLESGLSPMGVDFWNSIEDIPFPF